PFRGVAPVRYAPEARTARRYNRRGSAGSRASQLKLVLDTNIVLDWLHFAQPQLTPLHDGVQQQRVRIVTHPILMDELRRVLTFSQFKLDTTAQDGLMLRYRALTIPVQIGEPAALPAQFPRCRDSDDDKFLAIAYHAGADALVSRDKAL